MIKKILLLLVIVLGFKGTAQVGVNTTNPKAQLDIRSSSQVTPSNTDGLLIPKVNTFPATNPTADQQGMLVYLTTTVGSNVAGFYYWDNASISWKPVGNEQDKNFIKVGTSEASTHFLENKYTFGNNGFGTNDPLFPIHVEGRVALGRASATTGQLTFFPNNGGAWFHLENNGKFSLSHGATPGFDDLMTWQFNGNTGIGTTTPARRLHVSNGTSGANSNGSTGILLESNANVYQHFLSPSTAENGLLFGTNLNSIGSGIIYNNVSNTDGFQFRTGGNFTRMTLTNTGNLGIGTASPARRLHVANGTSGATSNANAGLVVESNGTVFQHFLTPSTAENGLLFGTDTNAIGSSLIFNNPSTLNGLQFRTGGNFTRMTLTGTGNLGIGSVNPLDRLHVVGNIRMVDGNQALGSVLTSDANGTASWTDTASLASGTLDQAYDFGGAGNGRTITADTGAVTINGTDGLVSTGTLNSGAVAPSGAGVKMFWNPRKAAFRAGSIPGTEWDDANIGVNSVAFGQGSIASGNFSTAFGSFATASGTQSVSFGTSVVASGSLSTAFGGGTLASGTSATSFGNGTTASGNNSTAFGNNNTASGGGSTAFGQINTASGLLSTAFGNGNTAPSYGETVLGIGATTYTPSTNGPTQFRTANVTDRLFVIGNAIDSNTNGVVDLAERSDAMVILKNGNTGIGVSTPGERLQVAGRALFTNGFSTDNAALLYRNDTDYMFLGPQSGSSADGGAMALFGSTNVSGGNAGGVDFNVPGGQVRMNHTNGSYNFSANSTSGYTASFELNDSGLEIGNNSASRALIFSPNSAERMRITPTGNVGIGTNPARKLHVSNGVSGGTSNANTGILLESSGNVYQHYLVPSSNESGMLFGSESASINGGVIFNNSLATNGIQFRTGGNTNRVTITSAGSVGIGTTAPGGQLELSLNEGRKPGSNAWTVVSDQRLKNVNGIFNKGLNEIIQLNPIRYNYKNNGERKFDQQVLNTEFPGFLAQEVQQIFPEAVGTDADGYLNFDLHPILIAYTNAFKELDLKNQVVENKNRELELKLKSQEQIINNLIERLEKLEAKN